MRHPLEYKIVTAAESPDLVMKASERIDREWPEFMLHDPAADLLDHCYREFAECQFVVVEIGTSQVVALGNSIPLAYDGAISELPEDGWDWAIKKGFADLETGGTPTLLCALQIVVFGDNRGKGISRRAVEEMKELGKSKGLRGLLAPVRPNRKADYPLISIDDYITWKRDDNQPFDPWLRVHHSLGAELIKPCHSAMRITGTVREWEKWTEMQFPQSGDYVIPGALVPIMIDVRADFGIYVEPNVWMYHPSSDT